MFGAFEGEWRVQPYSRTRARGGSSDAFEYTTRLSYKVSDLRERWGEMGRDGERWGKLSK